MITKVEYRDNTRADISTGSYYDWRLNSLYDPDKSGIGHQPMWSDEFASIYNQYRVFACKYELKIVLINGNAPAEAVALTTAAVTPPTSIGAAREANRTVNRTVPADPSVVTVLRGNVNVAKLRGLSSSQYRSDELNAATFGNNPINPATLRLFLATFDGNESSFAVTAKLTYFVECYDRKNVNPS